VIGIEAARLVERATRPRKLFTRESRVSHTDVQLDGVRIERQALAQRIYGVVVLPFVVELMCTFVVFVGTEERSDIERVPPGRLCYDKKRSTVTQAMTASAFSQIDGGSATSPGGFTAAAVHAGLKADGALDVALLVSATSCATAGVFTKNALRAAPVVYDAEMLADRPGRIRAVAMNARVANACTGAPGLEAARAMARAAEEAAGLPPRTALVLSTGVIGVPLPVDKVSRGLQDAAKKLSPDGGAEAARAIMTTDTRPKHCAVRFETPGGPIVIGGMAKGAGMIHPDMATLLGILTTDAVSEPGTLRAFWKRVVDRTFNAISVDGDTSTNDTVLLLANGHAGVDPSRDNVTWKAVRGSRH
jgi:glutamate N-acetyltransferase/amino-acid acetyltransferase